MLNLFIMRHAKSSWDHDIKDDFMRPLNNRGIEAAKLMGTWFVDQGVTPDLILSSDAVRTKETVKIMIKQKFVAKDVKYLHSLYHASAETLFTLINALPQNIQTAMIVGHNPGLAFFAKELLSPLASDGETLLYSKFPTAAVAHLQFKGQDWADVRACSGVLMQYLTPKQLLKG